ncbi:MAG: lamin tail domain-containing protein [Aureispira sp.]
MRIFVLLFVFFACGQFVQAQILQEDFSDGDFTANPTWLGTTTEFVVTTGELQSDNLGSSATSYLSTAAAIQDTAHWEFYLRLDFNPSTSNQTRVYLQADQSDLTTANDGYYLQIGASGSTDSIEIYRLDGGSSTRIFGGTNGAVATSPAASFRIIRSRTGVWEVYADYTGGTTYSLEGTFTDTTHTTGSHFGFSAKYTTTRGDKFFYDNIRIAPLFVDVIPPNLVNASALSGTAIDVIFDEPLDATTANVAGNYTMNNGATITNAQLDGVDPTLVHLTSLSLTSGTNYTITANGVEDLNSNPSVNTTASFTYYNLQPATLQDIVINEIFADPTPVVGLPNAEFVELLNRSNKYIDLGNLVFNDGQDKNLPSFILQPDSMVILTGTSNVADYAVYGTTLDIGSITLTNGGELLRLKDATGQTVDSVDYELSWYQDAVKDDGGWSLELINPTLVCEGANNWIASTAAVGGSPGQQNSVFDNTPDTQAPALVSASFLGATTVILEFDQLLDNTATIPANYIINSNTVTAANLAGTSTVNLTLGTAMTNNTRYIITVNGLTDCSGNATVNATDSFDYISIQRAGYQELIITEIMSDPSPIVGLPEVEYVEVFNNSNKNLDLANYILYESSNRVLPSQLLRPNEYAIICSAADAPLMNGYGIVVPISNLSLTNSGELLQLYNDNGVTLDSVDYEEEWYQDATKENGGWSLALINPNLSCKGGDNWIASVAGAGGTPGSANLVLSTVSDNTPLGVTNVRQLGSNQVLLEFDDVLNAGLASQTNNYSINNGVSIITIVVLSDKEVALTLSANMIDQTTYTITLSNLEDCVGNPLAATTANFTYFEAGAASHYDIIINEIMADPNPPVGLPETEYIELYNRSNKTFNLENFTFTDASSVTTNLPFFVLQPGEYVILHKASDPSLASFGNTLALTAFPDLNTSDELELRDPTGEVIDAVAYELFWYQNADKDDGGWSLERINPERPCEGASNWRACENLLGGTPATANSVLETGDDQQAPDALRAFPIGANTVRVYFSEAMGDLVAIDPSNYTITGGVSVVNISLEQPFYNSVVLTLSQPLVLGTTYTVTMSAGLTDCVGNSIALKNTARFALPEDVESGDLILNEILFNPVTGGEDFIELYNLSDKVINAADLVISNAVVEEGNLANTTTLQTRPIDVDWLIFPNEYVVLTEEANQVRTQYNTPNPENFVENNLPTFADGEGAVFLYAAYDSAYLDQFGNPQIAYLVKVLDQFDYEADFHSPLIDNKNGVSLERIDMLAPTNDANNWHSAASTVDYATPAYQNSVFLTNEFAGSELIQLPVETLSPDADGYQDFLLINYNVDNLGYVANIDVYDATGRLVRNLVNGELLDREGSLQWDGTDNNGQKARVGIHLLTIELFRPDGTIKRFKKTCILAGRMN